VYEKVLLPTVSIFRDNTKGDLKQLIVTEDIFRVWIRKGDRKSRHLLNSYFIGSKVKEFPNITI
jgi:ribosome maturation protein Sdo1